MGVVIQFSYQGWQAASPELANVSLAQATAYFNIAVNFQRNDGGGDINDVTFATTGLNLLVSHIAVLSGWQPSAAGGSFDGSTARIVGHVDSAAEGSVSVQTNFETGPNKTATEAWAIQTTYGATWWAMMAPMRTFRYVLAPQNRRHSFRRFFP